MKKMYKLMGKVFLSMAAMITVVGAASYASIGIEKMPESINAKR